MLERLSDRWKVEAGGALRRAALGAAAAIAVAVALSFVCAAVFVEALARYGLVGACLAGAAFFLVVALVLIVAYAADAARRRKELERARAVSAEAPSPLADPRFILTAVQIVQAVGLVRLLPFVVLGGAAFALASRRRPLRPGAGSEPRAAARPDAI